MRMFQEARKCIKTILANNTSLEILQNKTNASYDYYHYQTVFFVLICNIIVILYLLLIT